MPPANGFNFDGVHVFLTYPQCTLERAELRDFLREKIPNCEYCICRELHDDGSPHLHAYVHFGGRKRFASATAFDVGGFHPNIQKPRSARDVIAYCRKEDPEPLVSDGLETVSEGKGGWKEVLEMSRSRDEFLELARERFPRDYVLSLERLLFFCEWRFGREDTPYSGRARSEFREPETLTNWVNTNLLTVLIYPTHAYIGFSRPLRGGPSPLPC